MSLPVPMRIWLPAATVMEPDIRSDVAPAIAGARSTTDDVTGASRKKSLSA